MRTTTAALMAALLLLGCLPFASNPSGKLSYNLPTELTLPIGGTLPGTDIRYSRSSEEGAYLIIKGQDALKRKGDSVDWSGNLAPGVAADLRLRVAWNTDQAVYLVGTARVTLDDAQPKAQTIVTTSPLKFIGPVAYSVNKGGAIPGTTVIFEENTSDGARLGGVTGYPYRKAGDSLLWEGLLREGVYCRFDARVVQFDDKGLRVAGLVTLWVGS